MRRKFVPHIPNCLTPHLVLRMRFFTLLTVLCLFFFVAVCTASAQWIHGQRYLVLAIDGAPNRNLVWKDTAIMPVGSTVDLLVDMSNPGDWMMHCHIAEHLEAGMMLKFSVEEQERGESP